MPRARGRKPPIGFLPWPSNGEHSPRSALLLTAAVTRGEPHLRRRAAGGTAGGALGVVRVERGPNWLLSVCRSWQYAGMLLLPMIAAP